jgi:hypothetical protein
MEKMVMELYGRIINLEELTTELQKRVEQLESQETLPPKPRTEEETEEIRVTRSISRKHVIDMLRKNNPLLKIEKGNRATGADLIITGQKQEITYSFKAKFYHSKSHEEDFIRGWHSVKKDDVMDEDIKFYIFTVEYNGEYHTWFFDRVHLLALCTKKEADVNDWYGFYFTIENGRNFEARDGEIDVTAYYEKWDLPSKSMGI